MMRTRENVGIGRIDGIDGIDGIDVNNRDDGIYRSYGDYESDDDYWE
ncbi:hypothetical protein [Paenibacillus fonticola]|nr:hypothetical protein [Paenibacillus fonticola]